MSGRASLLSVLQRLLFSRRRLFPLLLVLSSPLLPAEPASEGIAFFERKVRPVLAENCYSCHGPEKQKGKLRLDSAGAIRAGGESGPVFVPGKPEQSRMILAVSYKDEDLKMPPKTRLSERLVDDLTEWVKRGAPLPAGQAQPAFPPLAKEFQISAKDRSHWAFQPLKCPATPALGQKNAGTRNPIDTFILAHLNSKGLTPNPAASKPELIRRAYYDLTGLPPSISDIETFLADKSPRAWESLIDRLLESPRYGEKWGRHWLDLVRYAESNSYERDNPKTNAWRYRDYVIRCFNQDKPYDRFIREQLAGDELPDRDDDALIATGFYRLGIWDDEPADPELARYDALDDIVTTTGQVFLGLTVDCARCHNHKLDPIPQSDYYRLLAFFQNITPFKNGGPTDEIPLKDTAAKALAVTENGATAPETFVLLRGNPKMKGAKVEPGFPQVLGPIEPKLPRPSNDSKSTGRRRVLADWIASPHNPLTARVMANRLWQYHFGRGIVRSPNSFGLQGEPPTNPELLDWLASQLIAHEWHLKPLHRLIMTSETYWRSSRGRPDALKADPANDHFWRFDMRRLTAEEIRDSVLAINGSLNLKMAGPGIFVDLPREVLAGQSRPGNGWGKSPPEEQARRSIYIHLKRSLLIPILENFDMAETDRSAPVRFVTVQPTQALGMLNSEFMNHQAGVFAARLRKEAGASLSAQIRLGLYLTTSRPPTRVEIKRCVRLVESLAAEDHESPGVALRYFCLMALNLNEMVYLD